MNPKALKALAASLVVTIVSCCSLVEARPGPPPPQPPPPPSRNDYLPRVGAAPLRFATFKAPKTTTVLPPITMSDTPQPEAQPSTVATANTPAPGSLYVPPGAAAPGTQMSPEELADWWAEFWKQFQAEVPATAVASEPAPSGSDSSILTPQMLVRFFNRGNAAKTNSVDALVPVPLNSFRPPEEGRPSSTATYIVK